MSRGYEPRELPLLYPAMYLIQFNLVYLFFFITSWVMRAIEFLCELPLLYPAIFLTIQNEYIDKEYNTINDALLQAII